jgi:hypothetical protein
MARVPCRGGASFRSRLGMGTRKTPPYCQAPVARAVLLPLLTAPLLTAPAQEDSVGEYSKHFGALSKLSIAVAQAMPPEQYAFRPHSESMNFGEFDVSHRHHQHQFYAGLKDSAPPVLPSAKPTTLPTAASRARNPVGHVCSRSAHRGQAENYLRDKGIRPPSYRI